MDKIYAVVGPTASGKSTLAIKLAKKINAEIISLDSMQVYKYMDIGTAKINESEMAGIKHHLIDIVSPSQEFSVSEYKKLAEQKIQEIKSRGKEVIFCGGTGLYLDAIIYDFSFNFLKSNLEDRKKLEEEYDQIGSEAFYNKLYALKPNLALKTHPNNKQRLIRYMEIALNGDMENKSSLKYDIYGIYIDIDRNILKERIRERVDKMFREGLISEIEGLLEMGVSFKAQSMQAIGYKEFELYKNNIINLDDVKELIIKNTNAYAKRQTTWFRRYKFLHYIKNSADLDKLEF